jgi:hypothetical protein
LAIEEVKEELLKNGKLVGDVMSENSKILSILSEIKNKVME